MRWTIVHGHIQRGRYWATDDYFWENIPLKIVIHNHLWDTANQEFTGPLIRESDEDVKLAMFFCCENIYFCTSTCIAEGNYCTFIPEEWTVCCCVKWVKNASTFHLLGERSINVQMNATNVVWIYFSRNNFTWNRPFPRTMNDGLGFCKTYTIREVLVGVGSRGI